MPALISSSSPGSSRISFVAAAMCDIAERAMSSREIIVVGGGIAGVSAATAARDEYPDAGITLFAHEPYPFYNKIALCAFITGKKRQDHLHFYSADWLREYGIDARLGEDVESIDPGRSSVISKNGKRRGYDRLILATGAVPTIPAIDGIDNRGVFTLWSLADAIGVRDALVSAGTVAIIGGGVLGVETAVELASIGKKVTILEAGDSVLPLHLDRISAGLFGEFLREKGIDARLSTPVERLETRGAGLRVIHGGAGLDADMVLLMAGASPDTRLARAAGIGCGDGIIVDSYMNTGVAGISACGNCAQLDGERNFLWNPARAQGEIAGSNAFENRRKATLEPVVIHLKMPEMPLFVCGRSTSSERGDMVIDDRSGRAYRNLRFDDRYRLKSAIFLFETDGFYEIEKIIRRALPVPRDLVDAGDIDGIVKAFSVPPGDEDYRSSGWVCRMCGYSHEGDYPPEICPVCSVGKDQFLAA